MFDAARAALLACNAPVEAESARTHHGLISAFGQFVVKPGWLPVALGKSLNRAQEVRLLADYGGDPVETHDAEALVRSATEFFLAVEALLKNPRPPPE